MRWRNRLRRFAANPISTVSLPFDDTPSVNGMHPAERDSNKSSRQCTDLGSRAAFYLPLPAPGVWRLRFQVANWGAVESSAELRFYAGGIRLRQAAADPDGIEFEPLNVPWDQSGALLIDVITPAAATGAAGLALAHCIAEPAVP